MSQIPECLAFLKFNNKNNNKKFDNKTTYYLLMRM